MIFLLQRSFGVDCDYSYTLYTYGPYSADVARDLDIVAGLGGAQVRHDLAGPGCEIHPGPASDDLKAIGPKLDRLVADFGAYTAKDLELRSTLLYLSRPGRSRPELIRQVHQVKPHFNRAHIEEAFAELEMKGYIGETAV